MRWAFLLRLALVAGVAYVFFGHVCILTRANGESMAPTYRTGDINFCWCPQYWFTEPTRGDIVAIRLSGKRVMLLKRVIAIAGDTIEFRDGQLFVNGLAQDEEYVRYACTWQFAPRIVDPGHVYVLGDNRSMPLRNHVRGQTPVDRIVGGMLW